MQVETLVQDREEYFATLYEEISHWAGIEGIVPLVSFLPQTLRRWGDDLGFNLERGGIWGKDDLTFGMGLGRWHANGIRNSILKLNFGATAASPDDFLKLCKAREWRPDVLSGLIYPGNLMSGEFKSSALGDYQVNCWANERIYGGDNLDGSNPYSLVSVVARTIRQGR